MNKQIKIIQNKIKNAISFYFKFNKIKAEEILDILFLSIKQNSIVLLGDIYDSLMLNATEINIFKEHYAIIIPNVIIDYV